MSEQSERSERSDDQRDLTERKLDRLSKHARYIYKAYCESKSATTPREPIKFIRVHEITEKPVDPEEDNSDRDDEEIENEEDEAMYADDNGSSGSEYSDDDDDGSEEEEDDEEEDGEEGEEGDESYSDLKKQIEEFIDDVLKTTLFRLTEFQPVSYLSDRSKRKIIAGRLMPENRDAVLIIGCDDRFDKDTGAMPREVRILNAIRGVPNTPDLLAYAPVDECGFYAAVVNYIPNCEPCESIQDNMYLIAKFMSSMISTVMRLHCKGVVHRDLAMANVLWDPVRESAVVIDFDLAAFSRPSGFRSSMGRKPYDCPQKWECRFAHSNPDDPDAPRYGTKTDVYSMGVMFWMLLNNQVDPPSPSRLRRWIRRALKHGMDKTYVEVDLLLLMLHRHPNRRVSPNVALKHRFFREYSEPTEETLKIRGTLKELMEKKGDKNETG